MRKVLVDNHEDDYEVEAGDTDNYLLSLTALCCVLITVQITMLPNGPSVANHIQFRPSRYMFDRNVDRFCDEEPLVS